MNPNSSSYSSYQGIDRKTSQAAIPFMQQLLSSMIQKKLFFRANCNFLSFSHFNISNVEIMRNYTRALALQKLKLIKPKNYVEIITAYTAEQKKAACFVFWPRFQSLDHTHTYTSLCMIALLNNYFVFFIYCTGPVFSSPSLKYSPGLILRQNKLFISHEFLRTLSFFYQCKHSMPRAVELILFFSNFFSGAHIHW